MLITIRSQPLFSANFEVIDKKDAPYTQIFLDECAYILSAIGKVADISLYSSAFLVSKVAHLFFATVSFCFFYRSNSLQAFASVAKACSHAFAIEARNAIELLFNDFTNAWHPRTPSFPPSPPPPSTLRSTPSAPPLLSPLHTLQAMANFTRIITTDTSSEESLLSQELRQFEGKPEHAPSVEFILEALRNTFRPYAEQVNDLLRDLHTQPDDKINTVFVESAESLISFVILYYLDLSEVSEEIALFKNSEIAIALRKKYLMLSPQDKEIFKNNIAHTQDKELLRLYNTLIDECASDNALIKALKIACDTLTLLKKEESA